MKNGNTTDSVSRHIIPDKSFEEKTITRFYLRPFKTENEKSHFFIFSQFPTEKTGEKGLFSQFGATEKLETENLRFFIFGFRSIRNGLKTGFKWPNLNYHFMGRCEHHVLLQEAR